MCAGALIDSIDLPAGTVSVPVTIAELAGPQPDRPSESCRSVSAT